MTGEEDVVAVWEEAERMLARWYRRARESQFAHYGAASRYAMLARLLGIPSVVLSALAGTALFASLQKETASVQLRLALGFVSVLAGVLAALQTFLGFGERADRHRAAGSAYGAIRREIEQYTAVPPPTVAAVQTMMSRLRERLDAVAERAPDVPNGTWDRARKRAGQSASSGKLRDGPEDRR